MKTVSPSGKTVQYRREGKHELRAHISIAAYRYLKANAPGRGIGQFISDVIDYHRDHIITERKIDKLTLSVDQILLHLTSSCDEPTITT